IQKTLTLTSEAGQPTPVDILASLYSEGEQKVVQFNIRDVTGRRKIEEQTLRNQELLRETHKMEAVGRLAGGGAHDFNNILTAVMGYADLLREHLKDDARGLQMLGQVQNGAQRATAITKQLLAFGRKQILAPAVLDLNRVITEFAQILWVMMPKS